MVETVAGTVHAPGRPAHPPSSVAAEPRRTTAAASAPGSRCGGTRAVAGPLTQGAPELDSASRAGNG